MIKTKKSNKWLLENGDRFIKEWLESSFREELLREINCRGELGRKPRGVNLKRKNK